MILTALLTLLIGCADKSAATDSADDTADDTAGSVTDTSADCPTGSHRVDDACEATLGDWADGPALGSARDHHMSLLHDIGDYAMLLVMGGTTPRGTVNKRLERARLDADGSLSDFEQLDDFDGAAIGQGLGYGDPGWVIVGGLDNTGNSVGDTLVMQVSDDGEPSFTAGPPLLSTRYHATATVAGGFVYVIGGMEQITSGGTAQTVLNSVERASFDGETLGDFELLGTLPEPSTHHAAFAWNNGLYLVGGGDSARARDSILRAEISSDGSLGDWVEVGTLPEGRATSAATVWLDQLLIVAGMAKLTGDERDTVLRADLNDDGTVGDFEALSPLPLARAHCHQAPLWQGVLVSTGGSIDHEDQDEVFVARFE